MKLSPSKRTSSIILGTTTIATLFNNFETLALNNKQITSFWNRTTNNNNNSTKIMPASALFPTTSNLLSKEEEKVGKIWNRFADNYSKSSIKDQESYRKKLEITREYMTPYSKVLEFGCGTGGTALLHAPYVESVHAIDLSSRMIEIANDRKKESTSSIENVKFECTGIDSLDIPDRSYDIVMGMSILHLLPNRDEILHKVYRKLKPTGYFISSTSCLGDHAKFLSWLTSPLSRLGLIQEINVFTKSELRQSMERVGFTIEREFHPANNKSVFLVARKL